MRVRVASRGERPWMRRPAPGGLRAGWGWGRVPAVGKHGPQARPCHGPARGRRQGRPQLLPSPRQRRHNALQTQPAAGSEGLCRAPCPPLHLPPQNRGLPKIHRKLQRSVLCPTAPVQAPSPSRRPGVRAPFWSPGRGAGLTVKAFKNGNWM